MGTPTNEQPARSSNPYAQFAQPGAKSGNFFDDAKPQAGSWQPPATDRAVNFDDLIPPAGKGGWQSAPVVGSANAKGGNFFDDLIPEAAKGG